MKKINTPENLKNLVVNILIVDDSPVNLLIMKRLLEEPDYNILTASSGKSALKLMMDTEFALAILDIRMPDMDGFELARMIKTRDKIKDIPIIFMSAYYTDAKNVFKGYSLGCFDYLRKPCLPELLKSKVRVFVDLFKKNALIKEAFEQYVDASETDESDHVDLPIKKEDALLFIFPKYNDLVLQYIRSLRLNEPSPSKSIKKMSQKLARFAFSARDIIQLHTKVIQSITKDLLHDHKQRLYVDARLLLIEIMGNLADSYLIKLKKK